MAQSGVVFFAMGEEGHFQRLRALISGIARRGVPTHVLTDRRFEPWVQRAGATFHDLFAARPLEGCDDESIPVPSRFVTFAAAHAETLAREAATLAPSLIVADTFSVIGRVVARILGIPFVNVCAGHNLQPARVLAELAVDPRVKTSARCHRAVAVLRDRHGFRDASPFSYVDGASPWLNLYCEPPAYLHEDERRPFEPLAFFGSLPARDELEELMSPRQPRLRRAARLIYVSFGTVIWRYYTPRACATLEAISEAVAGSPDTQAIVSLGRAPLDGAALARISRHNVEVRDHVDQWALLAEADVMLTHHGMSSTHEAIACGVPMISYPFFWDQPSLAAKCQQLGLAVPLATTPRATVHPVDVARALAEVRERAAGLAERLREARVWGLETLAGRDAVITLVLALARCSPTT